MTITPHHHDDSTVKTAKAIALAFGVVFLAVGILGFVPGVTTNYDDLMGAGHHSEAKLLGIFQVSILHNAVHILFGLAGLAAARAARYVPHYLIGSGVIYGVLTVYGVLVDQDSSANFVPINTADNWLHVALTVAMIGLGLYVAKILRDATGVDHGRRPA